MSNAFVQAAVILLREGLEAMLVIAALAAYLRKVGGGHRVVALTSCRYLEMVSTGIGRPMRM